MRKNLLLLPLILIFGLLIKPSNTFALSEKRWSVERLEELFLRYDEELKGLCGEDYECQREYHYLNYDIDLDYRAASSYHSIGIVVTSINPKKNAIRVVFHDEDYDIRLWEEREMHYPLNELAIVWHSDDAPNLSYSVNDIRDGTIAPWLNVVYYSEYPEELSRFLPNQEIEITSSNGDLSENHRGLIAFSYYNQPFGAAGSYDFSECINSPDYEYGMECRAYFDDLGNIYYYPEVVEDIEIGEEIIDASETDTDGYGEEVVNITTVKTPQTGVYKAQCEKVIEFPWWIMALIGVGNLIALWLFWPNSKKQHQK